MARTRVAVFDDSVYYVNSFLNYIKQKPKLPFEAVGFTDIEALKKSLQSRKISLVLFSREKGETGCERNFNNIFSSIESPGKKLKFIYLGEQPVSNDPFINKYQSMENIIAELSAFCRDISGDEMRPAAGNVYITGIYSVRDSLQKNQQINRLIENIGDKDLTLYIDLDRFAGEAAGAEARNALSELIYQYRVKGVVNRLTGEMTLKRQGLDAVLCPVNMEDLDEIKEEEWPDFLLNICEAGGYKHLILNMGEAFRNIETAFDMCREVYIAGVNTGGLPDARAEAVKKYLSDRGREDILEKIHVIG
ncbi:MAG: hypothetical protein HUJ75_02215 [Parasporobacterium sp.]|nr:hypothetical protein [Parasporobacterium sp.]